MNKYIVNETVGQDTYVIECFDEFGDFSHRIDYTFSDISQAKTMAEILKEETDESYKDGQVSTY